MKKLNKKFEMSDFTIESMVCELTCLCGCGTPYCKCNNTSDYYGYTVSVEQSQHANAQHAYDERDEATDKVIHFG